MRISLCSSRLKGTKYIVTGECKFCILPSITGPSRPTRNTYSKSGEEPEDKLSEQAINEDCWQIKDYKFNEEFFSKEGFTLPVAKKFLPIAVLFSWDAYHLFRYAKKIPDKGTYLEIGGAWGGSVICAYLASQASGTEINLISIDPFIQYGPNGNWTKEAFIQNTSFIPHLTLINSISDGAKDKIADGSIDLLFVDGNHHYEQVRRDLQNYWPKVKKEGVLLGHDYQDPHPGVIRAANEVFGKDKKDKFTLLKSSSIFMVEK